MPRGFYLVPVCQLSKGAWALGQCRGPWAWVQSPGPWQAGPWARSGSTPAQFLVKDQGASNYKTTGCRHPGKGLTPNSLLFSPGFLPPASSPG